MDTSIMVQNSAVCFFILNLKVANFFKEALMICEVVNLGCSN